jgi:flagellar biogenesis protein FliO
VKGIDVAGMERLSGGSTIGGIAGWLMARLHRRGRHEPRLALVERIALGPRQSLALVEAEGRRILVATSAEGGSAFYPLGEKPCLDEGTRTSANRAVRTRSHRKPRASW